MASLYIWLTVTIVLILLVVASISSKVIVSACSNNVRIWMNHRFVHYSTTGSWRLAPGRQSYRARWSTSKQVQLVSDCTRSPHECARRDSSPPMFATNQTVRNGGDNTVIYTIPTPHSSGSNVNHQRNMIGVPPPRRFAPAEQTMTVTRTRTVHVSHRESGGLRTVQQAKKSYQFINCMPNFVIRSAILRSGSYVGAESAATDSGAK